MQRLVIVVAIAGVALLAGGCAEPEPEITEVESPALAEQPEAEVATETGPVEVAEDGTVFDPPIQPERLPDGVWYCDMGTTHYAQTDQGEGTCPVCLMKLVEKQPVEASAGTVAEEPSGS